MRGICSMWIVYFHFYSSYIDPLPKLNSHFFSNLAEHYAAMGLSGFEAGAGIVHDTFAMMSLHAVGIFIVLSGFGITRSLLQSAQTSQVNWRRWFVTRFWRLYPFLWLAHLIFLVAPFIWQPEPIDWRFLVSLTGVRAYPMELMLFYANPAWWFFWLILQLYLVFPLLFVLLRKLRLPIFWGLTVAICIYARYLVLFEWQDWRGMIIGGFFATRLAEFVTGMALAELWHRAPADFTTRLTGVRALLAGLFIYPIGLLCYSSLESYLLVDLLTSCGLFLILAPLAKFLVKVPLCHAALALAGSVSLSTFLLHQPWTIEAGLALRGQPWWLFALACLLLMPMMVAIAWTCESLMRKLLNYLPANWGARRRTN